MNSPSRAFSNLRLLFLLAGLALLNLANYDEQGGASCNCSGYQGRMTLDPAYVTLLEAGEQKLTASFPGDVEWSLGEMPNSEVVAAISSLVNAVTGNLEVTLEAAQRLEDLSGTFPVDFGTGVILVPAKRTHLEIRARAEDGLESRFATILGVIPTLAFVEAMGATSTGVAFLRLQVFVTSAGQWDFNFDLSDAPSVTPLSDLERLDSFSVLAYFPLADTLAWRLGRGPNDILRCEVREPIHVTAFNDSRVLRATTETLIVAELPADGSGCPQPGDSGD